jgi:hypothetical protein
MTRKDTFISSTCKICGGSHKPVPRDRAGFPGKTPLAGVLFFLFMLLQNHIEVRSEHAFLPDKVSVNALQSMTVTTFARFWQTIARADSSYERRNYNSGGVRN